VWRSLASALGSGPRGRGFKSRHPDFFYCQTFVSSLVLKLIELREGKVGNGAINLAGILFGLGALIHLGRIFCPFDVVIGGFSIPQEMSYVNFIFLGMLSIYLFRSRHPVVVEKK
jgi:hypothetical protein